MFPSFTATIVLKVTTMVLLNLLSGVSLAQSKQQYFILDHEKLFTAAKAAVARDQSLDDKALVGAFDPDITMRCSSEKEWRSVNAMNINLPDQKESTSLCHAQLRLTTKSSINYISRKRHFKDGREFCADSVEWDTFWVKIFSDGSTLVNSHRRDQQWDRPCDEVPSFKSIDEIVESYRRNQI